MTSKTKFYYDKLAILDRLIFEIQNKMTLSKASTTCFCYYQYFSNTLNRVSCPRLRKLIYICDTLDLDLSKILFNKSSNKKYFDVDYDKILKFYKIRKNQVEFNRIVSTSINQIRKNKNIDISVEKYLEILENLRFTDDFFLITKHKDL